MKTEGSTPTATYGARRKPGLETALVAVVMSATTAGAWDFNYSYRTVDSANADTYLVQQEHAKKVKDWTGGAYWGPDANDVQATVTYKFNFPAPAREVFLHARLQSYNYAGEQGARPDYGFTSLWASRDGSAWELLLDGPTPAAVSVADLTYHQELPSRLLGATNLWIQARMQQHAALLAFPAPAATWTDAQFSRSSPADTNDVFQLRVSYGSGQGAGAAAPAARRAWRTWLAAAVVFLLLGTACLGLLCLGLLCVLMRRTGRQIAAQEHLGRRVEELNQKLDRVQPGPALKPPGSP